MQMNAIAAAVTAALLATGATPAFADPPMSGAWRAGDPSFQVTFNALDLQTSDGRAKALTRLEKVITRSCDSAGVRSETRACVAASIRSVQGSGAKFIQIAMEERAGTTVRLAKQH